MFNSWFVYCSYHNKNRTIEEYFNSSDTSDTMFYPEQTGSSPAKQSKQDSERESSTSTSDIANQIMNDETVAIQLQLELEESCQPIVEIDVESPECSSASATKFHDIEQLVTCMEERVDKSGQFFLVIRRGITFQRLLLLWQRE